MTSDRYITTWDRSNSVVATARGPVPYTTWCLAEVARLRKQGIPAHLATHRGRCCVVAKQETRK